MSDGWSQADGAPDWRLIWQASREAERKKQEVIDAAKARKDELTRDGLRSLFEEELKRRGMPPAPIWVEWALDDVELSPAERMRRNARVVGALGGAVSRFARAARRDGSVSETVKRAVRFDSSEDGPLWMRPPGKAIYTEGSLGPKEDVAVTLDPAAHALLYRALADAPVRLPVVDIALVDVWFDYEPGDEIVAVKLGAHRIGSCSPEVSQRLRFLMDAAAKQWMRPRRTAQLTKAPHLLPPFLVVVDVPASDTPLA